MRTIVMALAGLSLIAGAAHAGPAAKPAFVGAELTPQAKVTLDAARATALKARPGKVTDYELEKEKGGSGLRYSFDITSGGKPYEIGVDAKTGKVLENIPEGKTPD